MSKTRLKVRLSRSLAAMMLVGALPAVADQAGGSGNRFEPPAVPHPILSDDVRWAGVLLIAILAMFLLAAVVGPIVRAIAPDDHLPHEDGH
jgi:hypothetical protein